MACARRLTQLTSIEGSKNKPIPLRSAGNLIMTFCQTTQYKGIDKTCAFELDARFDLKHQYMKTNFYPHTFAP